MNLRKYIGLIVGCGIAALVGITGIVFLAKSISTQRKAQSELKSELSRLDQINRGKPFPSQANVEHVQKNLDEIRKVLSQTQTRLRVGQFEPDKIEPAQFGPLLEKTVKQMKASALANSVTLPDRFTFGFDRYSEGALPLSNAIPRLVTQMKNVAALCDLLYSAKVSNIASISREEFESQLVGGASGTGLASEMGGFIRSAVANLGNSERARAIPAVAASETYTSERFSIEFSARENAVWEVLNGLARSSTFSVVRDFVVHGTTMGQGLERASSSRSSNPATMVGEMGYVTSASLAGAQGIGTSTNLSTLSREDRVVAGREQVNVAIVVDVFRFASGKDESK